MADDAEQQPEVRELTEEIAAQGLSQVARTADGEGYAFVRLELPQRGLTSLGSVLAGYTHLRALDLHGNALTEADAVAQLPFLLSVRLSKNRLTRLPPSKGAFLQIVDASDNAIAGLEGLEAPELAWVKLDGNRVPSLQGVAALPKLAKLEIRRNELRSTRGIGRLAGLRELYMEENKVEEVVELDGLANLEVVSAGSNEITSLAGFVGLRAVRVLSLPSNKVEKLEEIGRLAQLPALRELNLAENPVTTEAENYRQGVLMLLPKLQRLDGEPVTREERDEVAAILRERREQEAEAKAAAEAAAAEAAGQQEGAGVGEEDEED